LDLTIPLIMKSYWTKLKEQIEIRIECEVNEVGEGRILQNVNFSTKLTNEGTILPFSIIHSEPKAKFV
jgi:hypothetical protein